MKAGIWMLAALFLATPSVHAAGKDGLWEITTKMDMPGMPAMPKGIAIPGMPGGVQKQTICLAEGKKYEPEEAKQPDCKVLEQKQSGNKMMMKVKCKEGTMTIENDQVSKDLWRSKVTMSGEMAGTINSEGKRIGTCDASKEGGMSREGQKFMGEAEKAGAQRAAEFGKDCQKAAADWSYPQVFEQYDDQMKRRKDMIAETKGKDMRMVNASFPENPQCAKAKADYCAKSKAAGREIATRKGYASVYSKDRKVVDAALGYCGIASATVLPGHCKSAAAESDIGFVVSFCPAERKELAAKHCAGRSYSSVEPRFQPLCGRGSGGRSYSAQGGEPSAMDRVKGLFGGGSSEGGQSGGGRAYSAAGGSSGDASGKDTGSPAVDEGVKQLKKLFGF